MCDNDPCSQQRKGSLKQQQEFCPQSTQNAAWGMTEQWGAAVEASQSVAQRESTYLKSLSEGLMTGSAVDV